MAARTIDRRRARMRAPAFRTHSTDQLARHEAATLGSGLDFDRERALVEHWLDAEVDYVERLLPRQGFIDYRPGMWAARNPLTLALVAAIVVVALILLPQLAPATPSRWSGANDVGRTYHVTPTPPGIHEDYAPQKHAPIVGEAARP